LIFRVGTWRTHVVSLTKCHFISDAHAPSLESLNKFLEEVLPSSSNFEDSNDEADNIDKSSLNFAHAALVLQNSSCVYSGKVEFLYSLVHQAVLVSVNETTKTSARTGATKNHAMDEFYEQQDEPEFILLDDLPQSENTTTALDFPEDQQQQRRSLSCRFSSSGSPGNTRIDHTHQSSLNNSSSLLLNASAAVRFGGAQKFRLSSSGLDSRGFLVLPGAMSAQQQEKTYNETTLEANSFVMQDDNDDDNDGFMFAADNDDSVDHAAPTNHKRVSFAPDLVTLKAFKDPWKVADSDTVTKARPLRIGKTIVLPPGVDDLPSDCVTGARTRRRIKSKVLIQPTYIPPTRSLVADTLNAARKRSLCDFADDDEQESLPSLPLKGLLYGQEFAYIAKATAKRRAAERLERRKQEREQGVDAVQEEEASDSGGFYFGADDNDDDIDGGGADNFGDDGSTDGPMESNTGLGPLENVYLDYEGNQGEFLSYCLSFSAYFRPYSRSSRFAFFEKSDSGVDHQTFEDLCRAHLRAFSLGAEKYANQTQLSKRVSEWEERINPILVEEAQRSVFDIHSYGQLVLQAAEKELRRDKSANCLNAENAKTIDFYRVTSNKPQFEICRMFLATLSLCNSGNVELFVDGEHELKMEIISKDMGQSIEQLRAPFL
jgi:condensin-2 complex subunit H2